MKILCVRESGGWGDVLCTLFAVRGLRRKYPQSEISYFAMPPFDAFLRHVAELDRVLALGRDDGEPTRRVRPFRRRMGEAFDPKRYGLSGHYDLIVDLWCPADRAERAAIESQGRRPLDVIAPSRIASFCAAAGVAGPPLPMLTISAEDREWARRLLRQFCPQAGPAVLIQQHSANPAKDWPVTHLAALADLLRRDGAQVLSVRINGHFTPAIPSIMGMSHWQIAALAAACACVIAPDSALFHLAAFVGTPCVALFGPTDPRPYAHLYPRASYCWEPEEAARLVGCRCPCYYYGANGFPPKLHCREEGACMAAIAPEEVFLRTMKYLDAAANRRVT